MLGVWREGSGRLLGKGKREGPKVKREGTSSDERGGRLRRDIYIYTIKREGRIVRRRWKTELFSK